MFVNRQKELGILNSEYALDQFTSTILYGRRRVGKTALLREFMKDKPSLYFLASLENISILLKRFQGIFADYFDDEILREIRFENFTQLFRYISSKSFDKKLVIAIDEFQYLAKQDPSIPSQFQYICDEFLENKNIHLIFCGSIISMMHDQTLSYNSPLYGRRTSSIKLEAIKFEHIHEFFPNKSQIELIELYSVLHGVPKYLNMFKEKADIFKGIEENILEVNSFLYNEPQFILQGEVSEQITYFSILENIASGAHKLSHIASRLEKTTQAISPYINKLIELDLVYKDVPITEKNPLKSRKSLYFIKDNFFRFWFCYVLPYKTWLEMENKHYVTKIIKQNFSSYISFVYENLAIEYVKKNSKVLKCGRWWDKDHEIDLVGITQNSLIVGECKYSNKKVGLDILESLKQKARFIKSDLPIEKYYLFSKSGFTKDLLELEDENIILVYDLISTPYGTD
ncbi:MAG: ATPase [Proteobacteria bacterium]|nr:MAG: ATPase [Pseudomonadota bacterium]